MVSFVIPALAIAYSLATSAYAVVNLPALLALANERKVMMPGITVTLIESGAHLAAVVSFLLACAVAIPCVLSSRTVVRVIAGALAFFPSFMLSSLIFLAVYYPKHELVRVGLG